MAKVMPTQMQAELQHPWSRRELVQECSRAIHQARRLAEPVLMSLVLPVAACDPLSVWACATAFRGERMVFSKPPLSLVALGELRALRGQGPGRYQAIAAAWNRLVEDAVTVTFPQASPPPAAPTGPLVVGGLAFRVGSADEGRAAADPRWAPFGEAFFQLPVLLYTRTGQGAWLTVNLFCQPHEDAGTAATRLDELLVQGEQLVADAAAYAASGEPGAGETVPRGLPAAGPGQGTSSFGTRVDNLQPVDWWYQAVNALAAEMRRGRYQKAVLARQVRVSLQETWNLETVLRRLQQRERHSYLFAFERGESVFVGATPERLVRLEGGTVAVACLAGSIGRGATEAQDRAYGQLLLDDSKNRREHQAVVETVTQALAPLCHRLKVPPVPVLLKTPSVQHLYTPVEARLDRPMTVLNLAERLHPTPAVCGLPREAALEAIQQWEPFDRGWYAGPVGWMGRSGDGELAVALRCGLLGEREALLYSGCGIMPDSDPKAEYEESCLKLGVMLSALGADAEEIAGCRCQPS